MSLTFATPTPAQQLQYASESLSDLMTSGMSVAGNFANRLLSAMPEIVQGFLPVKAELDAPQDIVKHLRELKLSRDQDKFLRVASAVPYSDLRELRAFVPAGLSATYLDLLAVLLPASEHAMDVRSLVIEPYLMLLAKLVSDKQGTMSTQSHAVAYKKLSANREEFTQRFAKLYKHNSEETQTTIKHVVERNGDWKPVLQAINTVAVNLEAVDLAGIQKQLAQCSDYLDLLYERLQKGEMSDATREVAQGLADGAYSVAQEMQFLSGVYFRALQLTKAVDDTIVHVNKNLG